MQLSLAVRSPLFLIFSLALLAACEAAVPGDGRAPLEGGVRQIIHGHPSTAPAHAAIVQMSYGSRGEICTATLIADTIVLTAAHCVYVKDCRHNWETGRDECQLETDPSLFTFRVGTAASDAARQTRRATAIHAHAEYDDEYMPNDIALLRIASPFEGVAPIPALPARAGLAWSAADVGQPITYVGFGRTESGTAGERLQVESTVDVVCLGPGYCSDGERWYAPPRTICSFMSNGGTCNGDSGGPALLVREGVTYVAGVTSFGDEDCAFYGCNTSVSSFADWIADYIGGDLAKGQACVADRQCASGFCTQGVCCDARCDAALCEACSAARGAEEDGICTPIVACEGESDCALVGTCDPATGACTYLPKPADTICDDKNACTLDDHCLLGQCVGAGSVYCAPPGECQTAGQSACQPESGACVYDNLPDGTACGSDGAQVCRGGACVSGVSESGCSASGGADGGALGLILGLLVILGLREKRQRARQAV